MTTLETMTELLEKVKDMTSKFPYSHSYISTLGGNENAAVLVCIGLDEKKTWSNGIFENSRYVRYHIDHNYKGIELECFQFHVKNKEMKNFRRITGTPEKIIERFSKDLKVLEGIM